MECTGVGVPHGDGDTPDGSAVGVVDGGAETEADSEVDGVSDVVSEMDFVMETLDVALRVAETVFDADRSGVREAVGETVRVVDDVFVVERVRLIVFDSDTDLEGDAPTVRDADTEGVRLMEPDTDFDADAPTVSDADADGVRLMEFVAKGVLGAEAPVDTEAEEDATLVVDGESEMVFVMLGVGLGDEGPLLGDGLLQGPYAD